MDVKHINPFLDAFTGVLPELGMTNISKNGLSIKGKNVTSSGVSIIVGLFGDVKGNVIYNVSFDTAKKIASLMMMGMPVEEFDEMAQSAISELTNMLTAKAATNFASIGYHIDISTPTLMCGVFEANLNVDKVLCVGMKVDDMLFEINIAIE